jgi:hypothetical protein
MATTGTYAFNPSAADVLLNAFALGAGKKRVDIDAEMLENGAYQMQMVGIDFTNRNPNRWQMETYSFSLVQGVATYTLAPQVVAVSIVYIDTMDTDGVTVITTQVLGPLSATDYASLSDKFVEGKPSTYFFNLLSPVPTLTLWSVPNGTQPYVMRVQAFKQQQDVRIDGGYTLDSPYRFLDAYTIGVASRLAMLYPGHADPVALDNKYKETFALAASLDQERVNLRVTPGLSSYFRAG